MGTKAMDGSDGISPRKGMAMGKVGMGGENFGVSSLEDHQGHMAHPDTKMGHNPLEDHQRGVGKSVAYGDDHHPAQAAPHHGPHRVSGHKGRYGKG